jgi:AcrR family transcriptional regulator
MDRRVQPRYPWPVLTPKGAATRARIVEAATDLVLERGVGGTSLDDIRAGTATSKSQLFHYFPGGKSELVGAIAAFQMERVLDAQRPWLDNLDTWAAWQSWRDAVVAFYRSQTHLSCSISAMVNELTFTDPARAREVGGHAERWCAYLADGLRQMHANGVLQADCDPERLALSTFAALQGGLLIMQARDSIEPLAAALDGALASLHSFAT